VGVEEGEAPNDRLPVVEGLPEVLGLAEALAELLVLGVELPEELALVE
jgi:hypothetical protein